MQDLEQDGSRAKFFQVDVSDTNSVAQAVKATVDWVKSTGKEIGGVLAAAGVGRPGKVSAATQAKLEEKHKPVKDAN